MLVPLDWLEAPLSLLSLLLPLLPLLLLLSEELLLSELLPLSLLPELRYDTALPPLTSESLPESLLDTRSPRV